MSPKLYTLNFIGDVMLGRLIDQLLPQHVANAEEARIVNSVRHRSSRSSKASHLADYTHKTPWGDTLPLFHRASLNLCNLETSATTHPVPWPNKVFNYRMHPDNLRCLTEARIDYAGLANNHTLDFSEPGLVETVQRVKALGVAFAGAGESAEEARRPAVLRAPRHGGGGGGGGGSDDDETGGSPLEVHVWAASDHPSEWARVPKIHLIDYSSSTFQRIKDLITKPVSSSLPSEIEESALKVFSVHWGPNYSWQPAREIRNLAHYLIDECGIDIIHGHSSHHVQGVERYKDSLIIYGCGDFVDDYALSENFRNDLSGVWQVQVSKEKGRPTIKGLEFFPTKIEQFQARRLGKDEADAQWLRSKIVELSAGLGTGFRSSTGNEGQLVLDFTWNQD